jgi:hypothetical protein
MTATTTTLAELPTLKGTELGTSDWVEVTQDRVNTFADATDDHHRRDEPVDRGQSEPRGAVQVGPGGQYGTDGP